ncbi:LysR substrate-binding domain-containing protein [Thioalkalivibrio paradoxus]|uniref:LysR family transcriptional regulator n=1 Tax=Thioalkalivibrio paradoxus ARh 1 TaxID=713585 RepID=W0DPK0_9GAMM|nr:LysR substrate-binding domain-containing protein [Thioalkalivibrio paradoxus]AHE98933.1 LysR family transcriptional regulator [Thioalkalivibrio paradoxus ARh 1]
MIELRHLRTLSALSDAGSLTAAAGRLHLTQSALSHQLKELEDRLGVVLVDRSTRPLRPTQAGRALLSLADRVIPQVDETLAGLSELVRGERGRLYIAGECHSCLEWLLPRLRVYRDRFPGVELDVVLSASLDPLPRLLEGSLDVVLSPDRRDLPGLTWMPLFAYETRLAMTPGHPLAARRHVSPADLAGETLLTYPVSRARLDVFVGFLWPAGVEPRRVRVVESTTMLIELAALGQGVVALPDWACAHAVADGRVQTAALGAAGLAGTLYAAVRAADASLPHVAGFLDAVRS